MTECRFCSLIENPPERFFINELASDLFLVAWDSFPVTPGHVLVFPRKHVQHMHQLSKAEQQELIPKVLSVKEYLTEIDLLETYLEHSKVSDSVRPNSFTIKALGQLKHYNWQRPDAFNDGVNDGVSAGQTVPHFHWHIMPRWQGDMSKPQGGIRHTFPDMGYYDTKRSR